MEFTATISEDTILDSYFHCIPEVSLGKRDHQHEVLYHGPHQVDHQGEYFLELWNSIFQVLKGSLHFLLEE